MVIEYENSDLVIVNKPAGVPVYSTKKHEDEESVLSWVLKKYPQIKDVGDKDRPGIVHRLDKQTSGLLIIAKTAKGFDYLKSLFTKREIIKEYLALVYGELPKHGIIDQPLSKIGFKGSSRVSVDEKGKTSVTEYWARGYYSNGVDRFTFLRVKLHTGRTHQIRVHFASIKHPVMGDNLYGKPNSLKLREILARQFLHASRLEFRLLDGTWLEVETELPKDLDQVLKQFNKITT